MDPMFKVFSIVLIVLEKLPLLLVLAVVFGISAFVLLRGGKA